MMLASGHAMCLAWGLEKIFFYNDAYAPMLGERHPAALGIPFREAWPDVWDEIGPLVDRVYAGETLTFENLPLVMTRKGYAEDTWWSFSYSPLRDESGLVCGLLNVTTDVSSNFRVEQAERERDEANAQLSTNEDRLRALVDASSDVLYTMSPDWSEMRALDGRGFIANTDMPTIRWIEDYLYPDDRGEVLEAISRAVAEKRPFELEHRLWRADGSVGWTFSRAVPVLDSAGEIAEWFGMAADVTARREAEIMLKQLNETLELRVHERSRELMEAEDRVRQMQKMEAIGQLTGGVAHDFNNLLTVIRASADLLRRGELAPEKRKRYIDAISDTADRAAKLTGQLLAFARRQALRPEVFDAAERVGAIADMLRTVVGSRVDLKVVPRCGACFIEADSSQFETALVNMAVNARDAMDGEGQLTIVVEAVDAVPALRGHAGVDGGFVVVSVTDSGTGIPEEKLGRIFEPFFTTKEVGKGTGLGLSQVYGFAKQSGGEVDVLSKTGEGATFKLYLPQVEASAAEGQSRAEEPTDFSQGTILIVEDNEQVGEFASQLLHDLGYVTRFAGNAREALAILAEESDTIDIVFSDVVMPGQSGVDLARVIHERWPAMTIVLTSGYSHVLAQDARHGFTLLHKPYSVEELSRVLRQARKPKV
ncbi:hybrid sensor histidine kinase/response regulator [Novosphingobium terrae]|uniref:hybrid sensor histidine kinase/response regulator n=1 Tax=Novosphingobium terrae TaxID=2726189 RepID=UPI00197EB346|nr:PAS domain-containing sensor histidine kinase [Novosphingobium terrae]